MLHSRLKAESLHDVVGCSRRPPVVNELSRGAARGWVFDKAESFRVIWLLLRLFSGWFSFRESVESLPAMKGDHK